MAPKKTKSAPNRTTSNLLKALKKNKSVESEPTSNLLKALKKNKSVESEPLKKKEVQPCKNTLSPEPVKKKPISANLQSQLSKKRKRVDQPVPEKQGLKLLKRGAVTIHRILRRKILRIKHVVRFNAKGQPYGSAGTEMQSYIGVLARTKAPIWYDSWKRVPKEIKNKIWDCVQMAFDVPQSARKTVFTSACQKWREFKSRLTTKYVLPYRDQRELLEFPPADYSFIEKADWDIFVADRLSPEFSVIHEMQKKRREMSEYPHYMSRKGYANLEQEISEGDPEFEIDRSSTWLLARQDKDGNYKSKEVEQVAKEIAIMKKKVSDGEVTEEGTDDVLTKVLGKSEHRGRVRGQGTHVKHSVYFDLPKPKRKGKSIDERIQEGVQKFMAKETEKIVRERDDFWAGEMAKLKAALCGKKIDFDNSPNIGSQQGSCSKDGHVILKELELEGVKKILDLVNNEEVFIKEKKYTEKKTEFEEKVVEEKTKDAEEVVIVKDDPVVVENAVKFASEHELVIGSPTNVVAHAIVDTTCNILHGKKLTKENARVSITRVIQGAAKIPFPILDEITTVEEAIGTFIAWPKDMILEVNTSAAEVKGTPKGGKKIVGKKFKKIKDCLLEPEYVLEMDADYPPSLKRLWLWAKNALKDGKARSFELCQEAFGSNNKQVLFLSDVHALCSGGEISGSVICMFINILEGYLKRYKMSDMVAFVDPATIGALGCGTSRERSRALSVRFKEAKPGQLFLLPYNYVNHWALTAVDPDSQIVYHMDPLKRRISSEEWIEVVDNAIKLYKDSAMKSTKKKITWENLAGVPLQSGSKDCGLFVMRYMKEICLDKELKFSIKWLQRNNLSYGVDELNEIRIDWAKHFMKNHAR